MHLKLIFILCLFGYVQGYALLEGLLAQSDPCFETIHDEGCDTSIPDVFTPSYKGVNINRPDTQVYLFTTKNQDKGEPLHKCGGKLPPDSDFDTEAETIVVTHGWLDGMCRTAWMREFKNQFFKRGRYNIILVDWTWGNTVDPNDAAVNSVVAGEHIAFVLKNIMEEKNMNGEKYHVIGHSFGCYAASSAGTHLKKWNRKHKIRRITALDPAVAPYRKGDYENKIELTPHDAKFVDVLHADGGHCFPFFFGNNQTLGTIDFYPNGGSAQPSCYSYVSDSFLKGDFLYALLSLLVPQFCFHLQAIQLFKVTINPPSGKDYKYVGVHCNSYEDFQNGACKRCCKCEEDDFSKDDFPNCAVAGMEAEKYFVPSRRIRGAQYFFNTKDKCPFDEDFEFSTEKDCPK